MSDLVRLLRALHEDGVRYVTIGVWGANLYASAASELFSTQDTGLFLPLDGDNLLRAWAGDLIRRHEETP